MPLALVVVDNLLLNLGGDVWSAVDELDYDELVVFVLGNQQCLTQAFVFEISDSSKRRTREGIGASIG